MIRKGYLTLQLQSRTHATFLAITAHTVSPGVAYTSTASLATSAPAGPAATEPAAGGPSTTAANAVAQATVLRPVLPRVRRSFPSPFQSALPGQLACIPSRSLPILSSCAASCLYSAAPPHIARRCWTSPPAGDLTPASLSSCVVSAPTTGLNFGPSLNSISEWLQRGHRQRPVATARWLQQVVTTPPVRPIQTLLARAGRSRFCLPTEAPCAFCVFALRSKVPASSAYINGAACSQASLLRPCYQPTLLPLKILIGRENVACSTRNGEQCGSCYCTGRATGGPASCIDAASQRGSRSSRSDRRECATTTELRSGTKRELSTTDASGRNRGCSDQKRSTSKTCTTPASYRSPGNRKPGACDARSERIGKCIRSQQNHSVLFACLSCVVAVLLQRTCRAEDVAFGGHDSTGGAASQNGRTPSLRTAACETCRQVSVGSRSSVQESPPGDGSSASGTKEGTEVSALEPHEDRTVNADTAVPTTADCTTLEDERGDLTAGASDAIKRALRSTGERCNIVNDGARARASKSSNSAAAAPESPSTGSGTTNAFNQGYQATTDGHGEARGHAVLWEVKEGEPRHVREGQPLRDEEGEATRGQVSRVVDHNTETTAAAGTAESAAEVIPGDGKQNGQIDQKPPPHTRARLNELPTGLRSAQSSSREDQARADVEQEQKHAAEELQIKTRSATAAVVAPETLARGKKAADPQPTSEAVLACTQVDQSDQPTAAGQNRQRWTTEEAAAAVRLAQLPPSEAFAAVLWQRLWEEKRQRAHVSRSASGGLGRCADSKHSSSSISTEDTTSSPTSTLLAHALTLGPQWAEAVLEACPQPAALDYFVCDLLRALHGSPARSAAEKKLPLSSWLFQPVLSLFRRSTTVSSSNLERCPAAEVFAVEVTTTVAERAQAARRAADALNALASLLLPRVSVPGSLAPRAYDRLPSCLCDCSVCTSRDVDAYESEEGKSESRGNCACASVVPWRARYSRAAEYPLRAAAEDGTEAAWLRLLTSKWIDALLQDLHWEDSSEEALSEECGVLRKWIYGNSIPATSYGAGNGVDAMWQNRLEDVSAGALAADTILQQEVAGGILQLLALTVIRYVFCAHAAQRLLPEVQWQRGGAHQLSLQEPQPNLRQQSWVRGLERQLPQVHQSENADAALRRKLAGLLTPMPFITQQRQQQGKAGSVAWNSNAQTLWLECVRLAAADGSLIRSITRAHSSASPPGRGSYLQTGNSSSASISDNVTTAFEGLLETETPSVGEYGGVDAAGAAVLNGLCLEAQRLLPAWPVPAAACLTELITAAASAQQHRSTLHTDNHRQQQQRLCSRGSASFTCSPQQPNQHWGTPAEASVPLDGFLLANDVDRKSTESGRSRDDTIFSKSSTSQGEVSATSSENSATGSNATTCANTTRVDSAGSSNDGGPLTGKDSSPLPIVRRSPSQTLRLPLLPEVLFSLSVALLDTLHPARTPAMSSGENASSNGFWGASLVPQAVLRLFFHVPPAAGSTAAGGSALGAAAAAVSDGPANTKNGYATPPSPKQVPTRTSVSDATDGTSVTARAALSVRKNAGKQEEYRRDASTEDGQMLLVVLASLLQSVVESAGLISSAVHSALLPVVDLNVPQTTDNSRSPPTSSCSTEMADASSSGGAAAGGNISAGRTADSYKAASAANSRKRDTATGNMTAGGDGCDTGGPKNKDSVTVVSGSFGLSGGSTASHKATFAAEKAAAAAITSATIQQASTWAMRWLQFGRDLPSPGGMDASTEDEAGAAVATTAAPDIGRVLVRLSLKVAELLQHEPQQHLSRRQQRQLCQQADEGWAQSQRNDTSTTGTTSQRPVKRHRHCRSCLSAEAKFEPLRQALTSWMAVQGVDSSHFGMWLEELRFYALQRMQLQLLADLVERPARLAAAAFFDWDTDAIIVETLALLSRSSSDQGTASAPSNSAAGSTASSASTSADESGKKSADAGWLFPRWFRASPPPDAVALAARTSSVPDSTEGAALQAADAAVKLSALQQPGSGAPVIVSSGAGAQRGHDGAAAASIAEDRTHSEGGAPDIASAEETTVEVAGAAIGAAAGRVEAVATGKDATARFHVARRRAELEANRQQAAHATEHPGKAALTSQKAPSPATTTSATAAAAVGHPGTSLELSGAALLASEEEDHDAMLTSDAVDPAASASRRAASGEAARLLAVIEKHTVGLETETTEPVSRVVREAAVKEVVENIERHEALQQLALLSCCGRTFPVQELWAAGGFSVLWLLACKELELLLRDPVALALYGRSRNDKKMAAVTSKGNSSSAIRTETQAPAATAGQSDATVGWLQQLRQLPWIPQGVGSFWRGSDSATADQKATAAAMGALLLAVENARKEREAIWREVHWVSRIAANAAGAPDSPLTSNHDCLAAWQELMLQLVHEAYVHPALLSPLFASLREQIPAVTLRLAAPSAVYYEAVRCLHNLFPQPCRSKDGSFSRSAATADGKERLQPMERSTYLSCIYPFAVPGQPHHLIDPLLVLPPLHSPLRQILQRLKAGAADDYKAVFPDPASDSTQHAEADPRHSVGAAAGNTENCPPSPTDVPIRVADISASADTKIAAAPVVACGQTPSPRPSAAVASDPSFTTACTTRSAAAVTSECSPVVSGAVDSHGWAEKGRRGLLVYKPHLPTQRLTEKQLKNLLRALEQHQQKQLRDEQQQRRHLEGQRHPQHQEGEEVERDLEGTTLTGVPEGTLRDSFERISPSNEKQISQEATPAQHQVDAATGNRDWQTCANLDASVEETPLEDPSRFCEETTCRGETSSPHGQRSACTGESSSSGRSNSNGGDRSTNPHSSCSSSSSRKRDKSSKQNASSVAEPRGEAPFIIFLHGLRGSAWRTWRCSHCVDEFVLQDGKYDLSLKRGNFPGASSSPGNIDSPFPRSSNGSAEDSNSGSLTDSSSGGEANSRTTSSDVTCACSGISAGDCGVLKRDHGNETQDTMSQFRTSSPSQATVPVDGSRATPEDASSGFPSRNAASSPSDTTTAPALPLSVVNGTAADTTSETKGDGGAAGRLSTMPRSAAARPGAAAATAFATPETRPTTTPTAEREAFSPAPATAKEPSRCACYVLRDTAKQAKLEEKDYMGSTQSFYYLWPRQLLAQQFPHCCILSIDYQAPLFRKPVPFCRRPSASAPWGVPAEEEEKSEAGAATASVFSPVAASQSAAQGAAVRALQLSEGANPAAEEAPPAAAGALGLKASEDAKAAVRMGLSLHPMSKGCLPQEQQCLASSHANSNDSSRMIEYNKQNNSSNNVRNSVISGSGSNTFKRDAALSAAAEQYEWDGDAWGAAGGSAEEEGPTLRQLGRCVQRQLKAAGVGEGARPIIFVAHSMGGLIAEYLLLHDPAIRRNTRAILFFSTPHLGSPLAEREWLRMVARPLLPLYVQQLSPLDATLRSLSSSFARLIQSAAGQHIRIAAVGELRPTPLPYIGGSAMVVPPWSSLPSWLHARPAVLVDVNHSHTCKPASSNDIRYTILEELVLETLPGEERGATATSRGGASCGGMHTAEHQDF